MSKIEIPTIERTRPERARQISQDACRGQDWIRTPPALGTTFALVVLAALVLVLATVIGTVRP